MGPNPPRWHRGREREVPAPEPHRALIKGHLPGFPTAQTVSREDLYRLRNREATDRGIRSSTASASSAQSWATLGVTAQFADGSEAEGALLIGADGIGSMVRTLIDPTAPKPQYGHMVGFGSWLPDSGIEPTAGAYHMMFGKHGFFASIVADDRRTSAYPLGDGFVSPVLYGRDSQWVRNFLQPAGSDS